MNKTILCMVLCSLAFGCHPPDKVWMPQTKTISGPWMSPDKVPLTVQFDAEELGDHVKSLKYAMDAFPCKLFIVDNKTTEPDVVIRVGVANYEKGATTVFGGPQIVIVLDGSSFPWANTTTSYLLFFHELGHVLGLDHDERQPKIRVLDYGIETVTHGQMFVSIMTPNVGDHSNRLEHGYLLPRLTDADEDGIEEHYCK